MDNYYVLKNKATQLGQEGWWRLANHDAILYEDMSMQIV